MSFENKIITAFAKSQGNNQLIDTHLRYIFPTIKDARILLDEIQKNRIHLEGIVRAANHAHSRNPNLEEITTDVVRCFLLNWLRQSFSGLRNEIPRQ